MNEEVHVMQKKSLIITKEMAEALLSLFTNCEAADAHFKGCQATQFRSHIQGTYKAPKVQAAFHALEDLIQGGG